MSVYTRIAVCRLTGVKKLVESYEEEREFRAAISPMMVFAIAAILICAVVFGLAVTAS